MDAIYSEPNALASHLSAPLLRERQEYLAHMSQQGLKWTSIRSTATWLLHVVRLLNLSELRPVGPAEIEEAARQYASDPTVRRNQRAPGKGAASSFKCIATKWLQFNNQFIHQTAPPSQLLVEDFVSSSKTRYADSTLRAYGAQASLFVRWFLANNILWAGDRPAYAYMAYLRHHGFPSPLLDWSRSPYVAVYFAFANA